MVKPPTGDIGNADIAGLDRVIDLSRNRPLIEVSQQDYNIRITSWADVGPPLTSLKTRTMSTASKLYDEADKLKEAGDLEGAVAKLHEALEAKPDYALAHAALAVIEQRLGKHEEAIKNAQRACELEPDDAFSFTSLSVIYQRAYAGTGDTSYIQLAEDAMERSRKIAAGM